MRASFLHAIYESNCAFLEAQKYSCWWKVSGAVSRLVSKGKQSVSKRVSRPLTNPCSPILCLCFQRKTANSILAVFHSDQPLTCICVATGSRRIFNFPFW